MLILYRSNLQFKPRECIKPIKIWVVFSHVPRWLCRKYRKFYNIKKKYNCFWIEDACHAFVHIMFLKVINIL